MAVNLNLLVRDNLPTAALILGVYYALLMISHLVVLPPAIAGTMAATAGVTALTLLGLWRWLKVWQPPLSLAHPLAASMAGLALVNSLLHMYLTGEPQQTTNLMLIVIGAGFLFLSVRWFIFTATATVVGWAITLWLLHPSPGEWQHFGFALFSTTVISVIVHVARIRMVRNLEHLRQQENHQRLALEESLAFRDKANWVQENLAGAAHALASTLDLEQVLALVLEQLSNTVPCDSATVYLLEGEHLEPHAWRGTLTEPPEAARIHVSSNSLLGQVFRARTPLILDDVTSHPDWEPHGSEHQLRSWIGTPLIAADKSVGLLTIGSRQPQAYLEQELQWVGAFADYAAAAVRNAALATRTRNTLERLSFLYAAARTLATTLETQDIIQMLMDLPHKRFRPDAVSVATVEPDGTLVFRAASGEAAEQILGLRLPPGTGVLGWVAEHGEQIWIPDVRQDRRFYKGVDSETGFTTQAIYAVPIRAADKTIAILEMINPSPEVKIAETQELLTALAALAAPAIQNAQLFEKIRLAEERYQRLFDQNLDPILILNESGCIVEANHAAYRLLNLPIGRKRENCLTFLQLTDERFTEFKTLLAAQAVVTWETSFTDAQGTARALEIHMSVLRHYTPEQTYLWLGHDITDRVALEETRQQLSNMIVHDLRNPLSSILNSLELIRNAWHERDLTLPMDQLLEISLRGAHRMDRLIDTILDTARLGSGEKTLSIEVIDMSELANEVAENMQTAFTKRRQVFQSAIPESLPPTLGDQDLLRRVMTNLLDNAIKFTPTGGSISIALEMEKDAFRFSVSDSGPGIPEEEHLRIFEPFVRGQSQETKRTAGAGLGLAFCKLAVEAHGGQIWVESSPEKDTTFTFTLPYRAPGRLLREEEPL